MGLTTYDLSDKQIDDALLHNKVECCVSNEERDAFRLGFMAGAAHIAALNAENNSRPTPKINMNDTVRVRLNEAGLAILRNAHDELYTRIGTPRPFVPPKVDAEGYSKTQLWSLMQDFGQHIHLGCIVPFETTILLERL